MKTITRLAAQADAISHQLAQVQGEIFATLRDLHIKVNTLRAELRAINEAVTREEASTPEL